MGRSPQERGVAGSYRGRMTREEKTMPATEGSPPAGARQSADDGLAFAGMTRLRELLDGGHATPRELAEFHLRRIERLDAAIGAFVSVRAERALAEADAALDRLRAGERTPLLGLPIA